MKEIIRQMMKVRVWALAALAAFACAGGAWADGSKINVYNYKLWDGTQKITVQAGDPFVSKNYKKFSCYGLNNSEVRALSNDLKNVTPENGRTTKSLNEIRDWMKKNYAANKAAWINASNASREGVSAGKKFTIDTKGTEDHGSLVASLANVGTTGKENLWHVRWVVYFFDDGNPDHAAFQVACLGYQDNTQTIIGVAQEAATISPSNGNSEFSNWQQPCVEMKIGGVDMWLSEAWVKNVTGETDPAKQQDALNATQANGMTCFENAMLGLDGNDPTDIPVIMPVQTKDATKITFTPGNIAVATDCGATPNVTYRVCSSSTPGGKDGVCSDWVDYKKNVAMGLPADSVLYYIIEMSVGVK